LNHQTVSHVSTWRDILVCFVNATEKRVSATFRKNSARKYFRFTKRTDLSDHDVAAITALGGLDTTAIGRQWRSRGRKQREIQAKEEHDEGPGEARAEEEARGIANGNWRGPVIKNQLTLARLPCRSLRPFKRAHNRRRPFSTGHVWTEKLSLLLACSRELSREREALCSIVARGNKSRSKETDL